MGHVVRVGRLQRIATMSKPGGCVQRIGGDDARLARRSPGPAPIIVAALQRSVAPLVRMGG